MTVQYRFQCPHRYSGSITENLTVVLMELVNDFLQTSRYRDFHDAILGVTIVTVKELKISLL